MNRTVRSLLVAFGVAMAFSALGVGVVLAEGDGDGSDGSSATTEETRETRIEERREALAEALGVTVEELVAAFRQVALDRVDEAVEAGKITEEKAEAWRAAIESGEWEAKRRGGRGFKRGGLAEGESLEGRKAEWKQAALDRVDAAVEAGRITDAEADELRAAIESGEKRAAVAGSGATNAVSGTTRERATAPRPRRLERSSPLPPLPPSRRRPAGGAFAVFCGSGRAGARPGERRSAGGGASRMWG